MALIKANRTRETSTSTGIGPMTLLGAVSDHRAFSAVMANGDTTWVTIVHPGTGEWETSLATYSSNTLTRTVILDGSSGTSSVVFSAGIKDVFLDLPASKLGSNDAQQAASITLDKIAQSAQDSLLAAAWSTGNVKLILSPVAEPGWIICNDGTLGNDTSGANQIASTALAFPLFNMIWTNVSNTFAPIFTSAGAPTTRGSTAAADFAASKRLSVTQMMGRALAIAGGGTGLSTRTLGQILGEETHLLTTPELPPHNHPAFIFDPTHQHTVANTWQTPVSFSGSGGGNAPTGSLTTSTSLSATGNRVWDGTTLDQTGQAGGGGAHPNMQPTSFLWAEIKL